VPRAFEDYTNVAIDEQELKKQFPKITLHEIV
jgi:hypothetical protein